MKYDGLSKYDAVVAASYDADRQGEDHWEAELEFMRSFAASHTLGRVLDVPVGTGRLLTVLAGAEQIVGLDVSAEMIAVAQEAIAAHRLPEAALVQGDAFSTALPDASFDTVVCFRLVHLLPPDLVTPLVAELCRVCSQRVLVQVYASPVAAASSPSRPIRRLAGSLKRAVRPRPPITPAPAPPTPWSHIESFPHTAAFLERCVTNAGARLIGRHRLSEYYGTSVEVLELSPR